MLKISFLILLFIFPLGVLSRFQLPNSIAISLNDILIFLVVLFFILEKAKDKKYFFLKNPLFKPILIFIGIAVFSLIVNIKNLSFSELFVSSLYLIRFILYAGLYFVVINFSAKFKQKINILLIFSGAVVVFGGYLQYFLYPALRYLIYLGWDEHLYRMFTSFLDPNFAGTFFVLYFLFLLNVSLKLKKEKKWQFILFRLIQILTLGAIFLTYSRSAFLMFMMSVVVFLVLIKQKKLIFVFMVLFLLIIFSLPNLFKTEGTNLLRTVSAKARLGSSEKSLTIIKDNIVFGVGFNAYRYAQRKYGFLNDVKWEESHSGAGTDNSFFLVLATTGIFGFAAYIWMWKKVFESSPSIIVFSSLAGLFVNAFFINSLFYPFIMEWIWIIIALSFKESN